MTDIQSTNETSTPFLQNEYDGIPVKAASQSEHQPKKRQSPSYANKLSALLEEPDVNSVQRLVDIFGLELVAHKVEEALQLYKAAQAKGAEAYKESNTAVATGKFKPRTRGGVFFFLMREHCLSLGLNWAGLKISPAWYNHKNRKQASQLNNFNSQIQIGSSDDAQRTLDTNLTQAASQSNVTLHNKKLITSQSSVKNKENNEPIEALSPKPSRVKATVIGSLFDSPKLNPQGKEGLLELTFKAEMGNSLPKGLPNMGESKIVVWCTRKQFDKISQQVAVTNETRFLIEGEPMPAVGADFSPFLRIICTRLTTVELEQRRRTE